MTRKEAALKTQEDRRKAKALDKLKAESGVLVKLAEFDMKPEIVSKIIAALPGRVQDIIKSAQSEDAFRHINHLIQTGVIHRSFAKTKHDSFFLSLSPGFSERDVADLIHRLESVVPLTPQQILERDHLERLRELRKSPSTVVLI
jgi:hypothetical protein